MEERLVKKKKKERKKEKEEGKKEIRVSDEPNEQLLLFNPDGVQDIRGRLWTQAMTSQGSRINQVIKVVNRLSVFSRCFYVSLVSSLELWTLLNCPDTTNRKVSND